MPVVAPKRHSINPITLVGSPTTDIIGLFFFLNNRKINFKIFQNHFDKSLIHTKENHNNF